MTIWWCEAHEVNGTEANCWALYHPLFDPDSDPACRMAEMRLIPVELPSVVEP